MRLLNTLLGIGLFLSFASANAEVFKRCDNCSSPSAAARSVAADARVIVVDTPLSKLYAFDVMWDAESNRWVAFSAAVPAELPPTLSRLKAMAEGGGTTTIYYDNRQAGTIKFPSGFAQNTSYDLLANATLRSQFLTTMATQILGSSSSLVQSFASFFYSIIGDRYGLSGQNVVIYFADGSKWMIRLDKTNVIKATLISAEDKYGNPMAIPGLPDGGIESGSYDFRGDPYVRDQWMYTAALTGVTFSGSGGTAIVCVTSGDDTYCRLQTY